jgi:hypothetical protein
MKVLGMLICCSVIQFARVKKTLSKVTRGMKSFSKIRKINKVAPNTSEDALSKREDVIRYNKNIRQKKVEKNFKKN